MATPHPSRPACQRKIMCLIPQTLPVPRPTLLTSMGKWANGKLKVEHVAAPQGEAGRGSSSAGRVSCGVCCPFSGMGGLWRGKGDWGEQRVALKRWHVNSLCELLRCSAPWRARLRLWRFAGMLIMPRWDNNKNNNNC